ncbi:hypothetical protein Q6318_28200, partial [Klebsiella pneumoniae]|nr:hypothetical protein [Klebsiella pneumoniae]
GFTFGPYTSTGICSRVWSVPVEETNVGLIGVEPAGHGIESGEHGAPLKHGRVGFYFGMKSPMMQTADGKIEESYSISAGLDFPSVGPQH